MHLIFIKEGITKLQLLDIFMKKDKWDFLDSPFLEYVRIKAFRLEPLANPHQEESHMTIDGKQMPNGRVQAEILPGMANTLANLKT